MSRRLDSFPNPLREYGTVTVEPSAPAESAGRLNVTGIDVRRFPWIRPLAGDYAYNFRQVEGLYAGDPLDPWIEALPLLLERPQDAIDQMRQPLRKVARFGLLGVFQFFQRQ